MLKSKYNKHQIYNNVSVQQSKHNTGKENNYINK